MAPGWIDALEAELVAAVPRGLTEARVRQFRAWASEPVGRGEIAGVCDRMEAVIARLDRMGLAAGPALEQLGGLLKCLRVRPEEPADSGAHVRRASAWLAGPGGQGAAGRLTARRVEAPKPAKAPGRTRQLV